MIDALLDIAVDLTHDLSAQDRYQRIIYQDCIRLRGHFRAADGDTLYLTDLACAIYGP
jgi:hypothetical protein